jgi:hypothetical protein
MVYVVGMGITHTCGHRRALCAECQRAKNNLRLFSPLSPITRIMCVPYFTVWVSLNNWLSNEGNTRFSAKLLSFCKGASGSIERVKGMNAQ